MRILTIRGENLASLRRFEVDLDDADGLGATGLFAITGPTGAGKSTLLDALCLALYDKTPRFDARSGHKVGRDPDDPDNLGAADVRNILRRGAGQGFAEVDFVGRDGGQYRARWAVHRARGKAGGRMQSQKMHLTDLLDGQVLTGATKSETLGLIEARTGLSFDQFRRSVLLAQGDFDAFLRAPTKERGALLERMTGTDIYRRISIAAHTRGRETRHAVQRIEDQLVGYAVLTEDERAALQTDLTRMIAWQAAARARLNTAQAAVRWHATDARLSAALTAATAQLDAAQAANTAAEEARARLAQVRRAAPIRPHATAVDRAQAQVVQRQQAVQTTRRIQSEADTTLAAATAAVDTALVARDAARDALEAAQPQIAEARQLDAQIAALAGPRTKAEQRVAELAFTCERLDAQHAELTAVRERHRQAIAAARTQQAEHAEWAALHADWPALKAAAEEWIAAHAAQQGRRDAWRAAQHAVRAAEAEEASTAEQVATHEAAVQAADAAVQAAEARLDPSGLRRAQAARQRHADAARDLEVLVGHAKTARAQQRERDAIEAERAAARKKRTRSRTAQTKARHRLDAAQVAHAHAQQALQLSRAVADLAEHRAHLQPGAPCPVCGATEHPGIDPALIQGDTFQARAAECAQAVDAAEAAWHAARIDLAEADARLEAEDQALRRVNEATAGLLNDWDMARMRVSGEVPERPDAPGVLAALRALHTKALAARDDAAAVVDAAGEQVRNRDAAHREARAAQAALTAAQTELTRARQATRATRDALGDLQREGEAARANLLSLRGQIEPLCRRADGFEAAPAQILVRIDSGLARWTQAQAAAEAAQTALTDTDARWASLTGQRDAQAERLRAAQREATEATDAQARVQAARAALLDGEPTQTWTDRLRTAVRTAEARWEADRAASQAAQHAVVQAQAKAAAAVATLSDAQQAAEAAQARLQAACAAADLSLEAAQPLLAHDAAWITTETDRLAALHTRVERARAVASERQADRAAHHGTQPAVPTPAAAEAQAAQLAQHARLIDQRLAQAQARQHQDEQARAATVELQQAHQAADAERQLWGRLDALIGSASGDTFREFAQSLTLDAVIAQANHHLGTLARRYRLMRVPGEDLALQIIDRHMGDEVRTVKSLSGGETFLVSLALALGLATLSAQDTRIESLFIDEGFGTLDSDTLDVVLDALDALQAAGRQIGLISHVPGLAQRIGVQVCVEPSTSGLSTVRVETGWGA